MVKRSADDAACVERLEGAFPAFFRTGVGLAVISALAAFAVRVVG